MSSILAAGSLSLRPRSDGATLDAMFDIGLQEMLVIGVLALLVFGPSKLPELGRMFGRAMREFRRASDEFRSTVESNLNVDESDHEPAPTTVAPEAAEGSVSTSSASLPSEREPGGAPESASSMAAEPPPEHAEPFCAKRGARLFHRVECSWLTPISEIDRVYFKTVTDARDQGFVTCPVCEPWQPT